MEVSKGKQVGSVFQAPTSGDDFGWTEAEHAETLARKNRPSFRAVPEIPPRFV